MTILTDISLNYDIIRLNQEIINWTPYPENITCFDCCSLECLEYALIKTVKLKILLPFFSVGVVIFFEIKEEKEKKALEKL